MKPVKRTPNGQLFKCHCKDRYNLEFGNVYIHFDYKDLESFCAYVYSIDYKHYLEVNAKSPNKRKILLNVKSRNILFTLNEFEFLELRELLSAIANSILLKQTNNHNNYNLN